MKQKIKIISIFLLIIPNINLFSQTILEKKISLVQDNYSIGEIFSNIESQSGAKFSYNSDIIELNQKVNFIAENEEIQDCLNKIFEKKYIYQASGKYIVIQKNGNPGKGEQSKQKITVKGKITGPNDYPIPNVSVFDMNTGNSALTDKNGEFVFQIKENEDYNNLSVGKIGYEDTLLSFNPNIENEIKITLNKKDSVKLNQVPISQYNNNFLNNFYIDYFIPQKIKLTSANLSHISGTRPFQISLLPGVSSNFAKFGVFENRFSVNVLIGYSRGVNGMEFGGLMNFDKEDVKWLQLAGLSNFVGGNVSGIQGSGINNLVVKDFQGLQLAGINNLVVGNTKGIQAAGVLNITIGDFNGGQIAGTSNFTAGNFDGLQTSGIINVIFGKANGFQIAGLINFIKEKSSGLQIAGVMNTTLDTINGGQIAGVVNVAKKSNLQISCVGNLSEEADVQISPILNIAQKSNKLQIAIFNISDTNSGIPIGLISYVRKGYLKPIISADELFYVNANLHMGTEKLYNIFNFSVQPNQTLIWGFGYGFGHKIILSKWAKIDLEALAKVINYNKILSTNIFAYYKFSPIIDLRIKNRVSVYFGPTFNFYAGNSSNTETLNYIDNSFNLPLINKTFSSTNIFKSWLGFHFALSL